jgi:hypothetical protein
MKEKVLVFKEPRGEDRPQPGKTPPVRLRQGQVCQEEETEVGGCIQRG